MTDNVWLIGTGQMSIDYSSVLSALAVPFTVIGRGETNCKAFEAKTGLKAVSGGVSKYIEYKKIVPQKVIVAVNIEELSPICKLLINHKAKEILLEKPGVAYSDEINELAEIARKENAIVLLAYNRRFYASVRKAQTLIDADGGVTSFNFEFTEWSHIISKLNKTQVDFHNWFLGNSTHVIDTAFFLGGKPFEMCSYVSGGLDWHPASSIFSGAGISKNGALFSYSANWEAPGRWSLEVLTRAHRFIFKPMEKLQVLEIGSVSVNQVKINDSLDTQFKPGLYLQTKAFLENDFINFCSIFEQKEMIENFYKKMSGYGKEKNV